MLRSGAARADEEFAADFVTWEESCEGEGVYWPERSVSMSFSLEERCFFVGEPPFSLLVEFEVVFSLGVSEFSSSEVRGIRGSSFCCFLAAFLCSLRDKAVEAAFSWDPFLLLDIASGKKQKFYILKYRKRKNYLVFFAILRISMKSKGFRREFLGYQ